MRQIRKIVRRELEEILREKSGDKAVKIFRAANGGDPEPPYVVDFGPKPMEFKTLDSAIDYAIELSQKNSGKVSIYDADDLFIANVVRGNLVF